MYLDARKGVSAMLGAVLPSRPDKGRVGWFERGVGWCLRGILQRDPASPPRGCKLQIMLFVFVEDRPKM